EHVAMREVDQLDDAVDHRVPEGDKRVDRALRDAEDQDLGELAGVEHRLRRQEDDGGAAEDVKAVVGQAHAPELQGPKSLQSGSAAAYHARIQSSPPESRARRPLGASSLELRVKGTSWPARSRIASSTRSTRSWPSCRRPRWSSRDLSPAGPRRWTRS